MWVKLTFVKDGGEELESSKAMPMTNAIRILKRLEKVEAEMLTEKALKSGQPYIVFNFVEDK